jgi:hypothetical protein
MGHAPRSLEKVLSCATAQRILALVCSAVSQTYAIASKKREFSQTALLPRRFIDLMT